MITSGTKACIYIIDGLLAFPFTSKLQIFRTISLNGINFQVAIQHNYFQYFLFVVQVFSFMGIELCAVPILFYSNLFVL